MTAAEVLLATASWFEEDTSRWGREEFANADGCRCALGGIAFVVDPADTDGDPWRLCRADVAIAAAYLLSDYLEAEGIALWDNYAESLPAGAERAIHVVGDWNDAEGRTVHEVIGTLRAAARWSAERAA